jgi:hypothetical protein
MPPIAVVLQVLAGGSFDDATNAPNAKLPTPIATAAPVLTPLLLL